MEKVSEDPTAPFGFDDEGTPKAPYGLKVNGQPRLSNRGAKAGGNRPRGRGIRAPRPGKTINRTDKQRRDTLIGLADMLVITPLSGLSASPQVANRFGKKHADAFAGDAVIIQQHLEPLADGLIELSQTKPGLLSWLDNVEQNAPWIPLAMVGLQMTKAFVENHTNPNPELIVAGKLMTRVKQAEMIALIHEQAREMGIHPNDAEPTEVIPAA
jgi:hypothetical protein